MQTSLSICLISIVYLGSFGEAWRRRRCDSSSCSWSWGSCSASCGGGIESPVVTRPQGACGSCSLPGARNCNDVCCPVDCKMSAWTSWNSCSATCGGDGLSNRTRKAAINASCGGASCPTVTAESRPCNRVCYNGGVLMSSVCSCTKGWSGTCCSNDIDECISIVNTTCHANAECMNTNGSYYCSCFIGFTGNGTTCSDIDECEHNSSNVCHANAECMNTNGSYYCRCLTGYTGNGTNCTALLENLTAALESSTIGIIAVAVTLTVIVIPGFVFMVVRVSKSDENVSNNSEDNTDGGQEHPYVNYTVNTTSGKSEHGYMEENTACQENAYINCAVHVTGGKHGNPSIDYTRNITIGEKEKTAACQENLYDC
ncbi:uncharacterized protein LOC143451332 [Clavelina lepadiformis]|uniref:uncharacterized protein LOC143451332 n=1 Tax=Clavelina lepadiformis TaxID=159417 RepID=UPI004042E8B8